MKIGDKYRAIIFDLDGTLIDSLPLHVEAFRDLLKERKILVSKKILDSLMGTPATNIFQFLKKNYGLKGNITDLREERRYHFFKILDNKNLIFPGVMKVLLKLKRRHKIALATGSSFSTYAHSTPKNFQDLFDFVVTINDVKKGKPHPDQFLLVAKRLKVKPEFCLVVGDSIYDAIAAKRAKMDFVGVRTGFNLGKELKNYKNIGIINAVRGLEV